VSTTPGLNEAVTSKSPDGRINTELSSRRTGMSFQRTRMSADRTLMSVIRTSLSLIGFGFTIFQFFSKLQTGGLLRPDSGTAKNFGFSLVALGVIMLVIGIWYHIRFMLGLRARRHEMTNAGLIHAQSEYPISLTLIVAMLLLMIGLLAVVGIVFEAGPLG
jgi:inner membrane protein YidH